MPFYDIIALISTGMYILLGRDIDLGETSRRRFCATQTRRSREILVIFHKAERHDLRVVRTHLGAPSRNPVFSLGLTRASLGYMRRESAPLFMYARWSPRRSGRSRRSVFIS